MTKIAHSKTEKSEKEHQTTVRVVYTDKDHDAQVFVFAFEEMVQSFLMKSPPFSMQKDWSVIDKGSKVEKG